MKNRKRVLTAILLTAVMMLSFAVTAAAEEATIYYFVDCGDFFVETAADGETMGIYNSVTEQFYGADPATGYEWGLIDEAVDEAASQSFGDTRLCTTWSWAFEQIESADTYTKEETSRYCRNMTENGLDRVLGYKFQMPEDGDYVVEVGFSNPWNNASPVDLYINGELAEDTILVDSADYAYAYRTCSPVDGFITVEAKSMAATINMTYIIISNTLTNEETTEWVYDTYAPNTDPETTAEPDETEAPASANDNDDPETTAAPDGDDGDSGCFGSGTGMAIMAVVTAVGGAALVRRKRH